MSNTAGIHAFLLVASITPVFCVQANDTDSADNKSNNSLNLAPINTCPHPRDGYTAGPRAPDLFTNFLLNTQCMQLGFGLMIVAPSVDQDK
jgi:hypothetical protein